jgi:hypothetical protein
MYGYGSNTASDLGRAGESFGDGRSSNTCAGNPPAQDPEVVMTVVAVIVGAAVLIGACSVTVLRRRGRSGG